MSWFSSLSRSKSKKKSPKRGKKPAAAKSEPWDPKRTLQGLRWMGIVLLLGATAWGFHAGEPFLRQYAARQADVQSVRIDLIDAPPWLRATPALIEGIQRMVAGNISSDPLRASDLENARQSLATCAWIHKVHYVKRVEADRIVVSARYREPAAVVAARDGYHLVDDEGVRLLMTAYAPAAAAALSEPIILTAESSSDLPKTAPCAVGEIWPGEQVQAALKLINLLRGRPYVDQIAAFDVSEMQKHRGDVRVHIVLQTRNEGEVHWGLPPGEERAIEQPAAVKLQALDKLYLVKGQIAQSHKRVDIYGQAVLVRALNR